MGGGGACVLRVCELCAWGGWLMVLVYAELSQLLFSNC